MSKTVDERVVQMQFNNAQFENGIKTSLNSLSSLKNGLNSLSGCTKGFDDISESANNMDFSGLYTAVEETKNHFSALEIFAISSIANIANRVTNLGLSLAKNLSIGQIADGWNKYELKTTSVQTLVNSTGKSIEEINGYLDKLMWFSDETSYGFTDMTSALGQLTTAGGDIDKLIPMIEGVANATAYAGKGTNEFSRAIYNLNQSYAAGSLQYMDWKSLELAGVASKELKQILIDTGVALGKIHKGQVTIANFSSTLKDKWATTDVMETAFGKFAEVTQEAYKLVQDGTVDTASAAYEILEASGKFDEFAIRAAKSAQEAKSFNEAIAATKDAVSSGWMKSFEIIFGNYDEAKQLWTDLANTLWDIFASGAEKRNEFLQGWKDLGGRDELLKIFSNLYTIVSSFTTAISDAFHKIFSGISSEQLYNFTKWVADATENIKNLFLKTKKPINETKDLISKVINVKQLDATNKAVNTTANLWKGVLIPPLTEIDNTVTKLSKETESGTIYKLDSFIGGFQAGLKALFGIMKQIFTAGYDIVTKVFSPIVDALGILGQAIQKALSKSTDGFGEYLGDVSNYIATTDLFKNAVEKIVDFLLPISEKIASAIKWIANAIETGEAKLLPITKVIEKVKQALQDFFKKFSSFDKVKTTVFDAIANGAKKLWSTISKVVDSIIKAVKTLTNSINSPFNTGYQSNFWTFLGGVGAITATGSIKKFLENLKIFSGKKGLANDISELISSVGDAFASIKQNVDIKMIEALSKAVAIFAASIFVLALLDQKKLIGGLSAIAIVMDALEKTMENLSKNINSNATKVLRSVSVAMLAMSVSILILAASLKMLSDVGTEGLVGGLVAVGVLLAMMTKVAKSLSDTKSTKVTKGLTGLIGMAASIYILTKSVKALGELDYNTLTAGLASVGTLILAIGAFLKLTSDTKFGIGKGIGLVLLASSLVILSTVVKKLSSFSLVELAKGLGAVGILLLELASFTKLVDSKRLISLGVSVAILSAGMLVLTQCVKQLGALDPAEIVNGLGALGGVLAEIALALWLIPKNTIAKSTGILILAVAINVLNIALKSFAKMSWEQVGITLSVLGGSLLELALALRVMNKSIKGAAALTIASVAINILAIALKSLAKMSLSDIAISLGVLAGALVILGVAGAVLSPLAPTLMTLASSFAIFGLGAMALGAGLILVSAGLLALAASLSGSVTVIVAGLAVLAKGVLDILVVLLQELAIALASAVPMLAAGITMTISALLKAITTIAPEIVGAILELFGSVMLELGKHIYELVSSLILIIVNVLEAVSDNLNPLLNAAVKLIVTFFYALANAIATNSESIIGAIGAVISALLVLITEALEQLLKAILQWIPGAESQIEEVFGGFQDKLKEGMKFDSGDGEENPGSQAMDSVITGITGKQDELTESVNTVQGTAYDSLISKIQEAYPFAGTEMVDQVSNGITSKESVKNITNAGVSIGENGNDGAESTEPLFEQTGIYLGDGLIKGMSNEDMLGRVYNSGFNLSYTAIQGVNAGSQVNSPSKLSALTGKFIDMGLANGLTDFSNLAVQAAFGVSTETINALNSAMESAKTVAFTDNISPVIRPVLDLSNVSDGATNIDNLMSSQRAFEASVSYQSNTDNSLIKDLLDVTTKLLKSVQNGSDLYLDEDILVGRINRRLGQL